MQAINTFASGESRERERERAAGGQLRVVIQETLGYHARRFGRLCVRPDRP